MDRNKLSIEEIKKAIEEQVRHSYLEKFIDQPLIDEDKLFLLISVFHDSPYSEKQQKDLVITAMLVQIALDTHDRVSLDDAVSEPDGQKKKRQLTVLAGDYYSGLYYYLLSKLEDIQMIKTLASAIKEINEAKMAVYYKKFPTLKDFIAEVQQVESLLVRRVAEQFGEEQISNFAADWLLKNKLMNEKESYLKDGSSGLFHLLMNGSVMELDNAETISMVENFIDIYTERAKVQAGQLPDQLVTLHQ